MSLPVRTTPEADAHIREIDSWWRGNRPASPELFVEELSAAFDIVGHAPHIGRLYRQSPIPSTRRVLLKGTGYHVYYVPLAAEVRVLAVWHARRGVGPPLRAS
ncbi:MAG: type II toxin-antitoxin system RelE/ParE family toxin [Gammaproteobacteria bacterium]